MYTWPGKRTLKSLAQIDDQNPQQKTGKAQPAQTGRRLSGQCVQDAGHLFREQKVRNAFKDKGQPEGAQ